MDGKVCYGIVLLTKLFTNQAVSQRPLRGPKLQQRHHHDNSTVHKRI